MTNAARAFRSFRFPAEVILWCLSQISGVDGSSGVAVNFSATALPVPVFHRLERASFVWRIIIAYHDKFF
jgi:hypothetical protein